MMVNTVYSIHHMVVAIAIIKLICWVPFHCLFMRLLHFALVTGVADSIVVAFAMCFVELMASFGPFSCYFIAKSFGFMHKYYFVVVIKPNSYSSTVVGIMATFIVAMVLVREFASYFKHLTPISRNHGAYMLTNLVTSLKQITFVIMVGLLVLVN